jgi:uncharacterized Fe-S radical SAM superfamily protein PflX
MDESIKKYAAMASIAKRLVDTNSNYICVIAKNPDGYIDVYLNDVPLKGKELANKVAELKDAINRMKETIRDYEDKIRYNG